MVRKNFFNIKETLFDEPKYKDYKSTLFNVNKGKKTIIGEGSFLKIKSEGVEMFELELTEDVVLNLNSQKIYSIYLFLICKLIFLTKVFKVTKIT
mgnify:CR=1 FL=1